MWCKVPGCRTPTEKCKCSVVLRSGRGRNCQHSARIAMPWIAILMGQNWTVELKWWQTCNSQRIEPGTTFSFQQDSKKLARHQASSYRLNRYWSPLILLSTSLAHNFCAKTSPWIMTFFQQTNKTMINACKVNCLNLLACRQESNESASVGLSKISLPRLVWSQNSGSSQEKCDPEMYAVKSFQLHPATGFCEWSGCTGC